MLGTAFCFSWEDPGICTPTIDSTPKQPRRTLHPAEDLQAHAKYFNFKRRKVQDKDEATLLYQVYITSTFPQLLHQPVSVPNRFPPHHRQGVEPVPPPFHSP